MSCPRISMSAFLLFWALVAVSAQSYFPPNPCPESFRYGYDQAGNVMGLVTLPFDGTRALQLEINATAAGVKRQGNQKMKVVLLTSPEDIFNQNVLTVRYHVVFPTNIPTPKVTRISLNQREHCAGPADRVYLRGPPVSRLWAKHNLVVDSSNRAVVEYDYDYDNEFMRDHNSTTDVPSSVTDPKKEGDDKTKLRQFRVPERPNIVLEFQKPDMYNLQDMEEPEPFFFY